MADPFVRTREEAQQEETEAARQDESAAHKAKERALGTFEYVAKCRECEWSVEWESADTWRKGAPREHVRATGHTVDTEMRSTSVLMPGPAAAVKAGVEKPDPKDKYIAYCKQCQRYIGVKAGRFFNAAWKSHQKKTKHDVSVKPNPRYSRGA